MGDIPVVLNSDSCLESCNSIWTENTKCSRRYRTQRFSIILEKLAERTLLDIFEDRSFTIFLSDVKS